MFYIRFAFYCVDLSLDVVLRFAANVHFPVAFADFRRSLPLNPAYFRADSLDFDLPRFIVSTVGKSG